MTSDESLSEEAKRAADEYFADPAVQQGIGELIQAEQACHLSRGDDHLYEGRYREAIEEYRQDLDLEITTYAVASVVERAFCHMGDAYLFLGDLENAAAAYTEALAVWQEYGYGEMPLASLAAVYLRQGRLDDVLRLGEEHPEEAEDPCMRQALEEARRLKAGAGPSPEPVRGCRLIRLPFRHPGPLPR